MGAGAIALSGNPTAATAGGSQPFPVVQPYLALNYCIALVGIFPSRN
jgi:microcystin-dependent protein